MIDPLEVWKQIGICDYESNNSYRAALVKKGVEQSDIDLLDPDNTDQKVFWRNVTELDDSSIASEGMTNRSVFEINQFNQRMIRMTGVLDFMRLTPLSNVLEIGPGFGSLYSLLPHYVNYVGVDACVRFGRVVEGTDGIPENYVETWKNKFDYVVSINVFQHLGVKQKENYIRDALRCLHTNGTFILSMGIANEWTDLKDSEGNPYVYTGAQLVRLWHIQEYEDLVEKIALEENVNIFRINFQTYPGLATFYYRVTK